LARAARRAGAGRAARAEAGGVGVVGELPEFGLGYPRTDLRRLLVEAVLSGEKTATAGLHDDAEPPPSPGDRYVVEDETDTPRAIVEVTEVRLAPAGEIDLPFARAEGEGFKSVEKWREAHERFFERPLPPETLIDAVRFRVVERL
jgi:uncharacterized protein YhfF